MEVKSQWPLSMDGDYPLYVVSILFGGFILFWWDCPSLELGWSTQKMLVTNYRGPTPPTEGGHELQKPLCKC